MRSLYVCLALAGCAQAKSTDGDDEPVDAAVVRTDASPQLTDGSPQPIVDAPPGPCTTSTVNILDNSSFDGTPAGVDWNATPIDPAYPLVTNAVEGVPAQSATYRAWLGGFEQSASTNKDVMYQDVAIPATTTRLELKGYFDLRTGETTAGIYDRATVELTTTTNTQLELVRALDDNGATTLWTPFSKVFTGSYAGMTVRVRLSSASDIVDPTSFYFDTFELLATVCQ
jgi:hypothetical protein